MAKKRKKKGRSYKPNKNNATKKRRLPEALGWETFAVLIVPCIIGSWYFLRPLFEEDAALSQRLTLVFVVGVISAALITCVANAVWRRVMNVK